MFVDFSLAVLTHRDVLLVGALLLRGLLVHVKVEIARLWPPLIVVQVPLVPINKKSLGLFSAFLSYSLSVVLHIGKLILRLGFTQRSLHLQPIIILIPDLPFFDGAMLLNIGNRSMIIESNSILLGSYVINRIRCIHVRVGHLSAHLMMPGDIDCRESLNLLELRLRNCR